VRLQMTLHRWNKGSAGTTVAPQAPDVPRLKLGLVLDVRPELDPDRQARQHPTALALTTEHHAAIRP